MRTECEVTSTRALYNIIIKVPSCKRLAACEMALDVIGQKLGTDSYMYNSIMTMKVVCLVHGGLRRLMEDCEKSLPVHPLSGGSTDA